MLRLAALALLLVACGDDIQFAKPPAATGDAPAVSAEADPFADPHEEAPPAAVRGAEEPAADTVYFTGRVELAAGFTPPETCTVYVMAGPAPTGRPPLLSRRYEKPVFPLQFELRHSDIPFRDSTVAGPQVLTVILSEKGPVLATEGVYLRCPLEAPQAPGTQGIVLSLHR